MENGSTTATANDTSLSIIPFSNRDTFDRLFVVCLICLITIANMLMGCELDPHVVLSTIRRPVAPAIGFFTQFAIMPILAYSIALLVLSSSGEHLLALGLFVTGCSPGGGASNYWTILLAGNVNLSITMTFLSNTAAMAMMPLWIRFLGVKLVQAVSPTATVRIPYSKIVASLVILVLPLLIGLLIAKWRPNWANKARSFMRPFMISILVFIIAFGVFINFWLLKLITWRTLLAGMLLPWCGFMFGCFSALLLTKKPADITAIAIETGIQNTGIAIMMLKLSLPGSQGDMASLLPIVVACFTPIPLLFAYFLHNAFRGKRESEQQQQISEDPALLVIYRNDGTKSQASPPILLIPPPEN